MVLLAERNGKCLDDLSAYENQIRISIAIGTNQRLRVLIHHNVLKVIILLSNVSIITITTANFQIAVLLLHSSQKVNEILNSFRFRIGIAVGVPVGRHFFQSDGME